MWPQACRSILPGQSPWMAGSQDTITITSSMVKVLHSQVDPRHQSVLRRARLGRGYGLLTRRNKSDSDVKPQITELQ